LAIAVFEASPEELAAATLIAEILNAKGRGELASEALRRLVDAYVRRGDMGSATVAACLAVDAGEDGEALRTSIAKAFAKGSKRATADASPAPPPLPKKVDVDGRLAKLKGDPLLDRAEDALRAFLASDDAVDEKSKVPILPLASALAATTLTRLLEAATIIDAKAGASIIEQGTEGKAAYQVVRGMAEAIRVSDDAEVRLAALGPGALFGEMALVSDAPRAASVRAIEATRFLCFPRDTLEKLAQRDANLGKELGRFCQARMVANLVRHSSILAAVAPSDREALMERFETRTFDAGARLVSRGEETQGLFLIASGTVAVTSVDDDGDRIHIADLGPGDVVGEISLVLRRPATADVTAVHSTIALELSREQFQEAIKEHPSLLSELYDLATTREDETNSVVAQEALDVGDIVLL
jgi:cAMP-dependent protein kinase regulator